MAWSDLFERAADTGADVEAVRAALEEVRADRAADEGGNPATDDEEGDPDNDDEGGDRP